MSKRTEQRLRRQIRDLEKRLSDVSEMAVIQVIKHAGSYKMEQADIYKCALADFPEWLQATCKTAWVAGGHIAMMRRDDGMIGFRFERRIYS